MIYEQDFWNERYSRREYIYGEAPNDYLASKLPLLPSGKLLCVAEGEGRNAVFAARLGWQVEAFDISTEAKQKADMLAKKHNVVVNYQVGDLDNTVVYQEEQFDAIVLIYAHFLTQTQHHVTLTKYLKRGGVVILEAFTPNHLRINTTGSGPKDEKLLYTVEKIQQQFGHLEVVELYETVVELNEGLFHQGTSSVIRFVGRKK